MKDLFTSIGEASNSFFEQTSSEDKKVLVLAILLAVLFHVIFFLLPIKFPEAVHVIQSTPIRTLRILQIQSYMGQSAILPKFKVDMVKANPRPIPAPKVAEPNKSMHPEALPLFDQMDDVDRYIKVAGNCDFHPSLPLFNELVVGTHRVLVTHGHELNIKSSLQRMLYLS